MTIKFRSKKLKKTLLTLLYFIKNLLANVKRTLKLAFFKAKWKAHNRHNHTRAENLFPLEQVSIGKETYGSLTVHAYNAQHEKLTIGNYCSIAENVHFILSGEHDYKRFSTFPFVAYYGEKEVDAFSKGEIVLEDDVWIGYGAMILSGVRIGKGAVIAAGSVISKDVPPYAVVGGYNQLIRYRFPAEIIEKLSSVSLEKVDPLKIRNSACSKQHVTEENLEDVIAQINSCITI